MDAMRKHFDAAVNTPVYDKMIIVRTAHRPTAEPAPIGTILCSICTSTIILHTTLQWVQNIPQTTLFSDILLFNCLEK